MKEKYLHVVAFNVPYPPNYGGIIDIYYKLKSLSDAGIKIILHSFVYGREEVPELDELCHSTYYYTRQTGLKSFFNKLPYIVSSRRNDLLRERLLTDSHPVLFEGLHSCYYLPDCKEAGKRVLVRTHNIEHNYYKMLSKSERFFVRKFYFSQESKKLEKYESILRNADQLLSISLTDTSYFNTRYDNSTHVSAFHQHEKTTARQGNGDYILFHGNLSVPENEKALIYLVKNVLSRIAFRVIIAGKNPGNLVRKYCNRHSNIELISSPEGEKMRKLVEEAHINLLYTYQPTGLKLKLLHSLYGGRFCMANPLMLSGSGLDDLCSVYRSPDEAVQMINELMGETFSAETIKEREKKLETYSNSYNVNKILGLLPG